MPLLNSITTPYADAFLQLTESAGETDTVITQTRELLSLWQASPELREAMVSPVLDPEAKKSVLLALFGQSLTPTFLNLLKLLADRRRIGVLDAVLERMLELHRERNGIALAKITAATPLSEEQQAQLTEKVKAVAGTDKVEIDTAVDPSLIGGFVLRVGSKVIDASLLGQVRRLGLALATAG
ncbi:MAG: F0F1 ATP synthase subunit delta [Cyanobacteria bacterium K_Offshore_surface_m2_239]|nr:F0F1 ATP synthase subunit delta [Cyanobacteria bacterium K_Offshore_surface_m2_239]